MYLSPTPPEPDAASEMERYWRNERSQVRKPVIDLLLAYADKDGGQGNESRSETNESSSTKALCELEEDGSTSIASCVKNVAPNTEAEAWAEEKEDREDTENSDVAAD